MAATEKTTSFVHQTKARKASREGRGWKEAFAWLMEMGTGKSKVDIDETCEMFLAGVLDIWVIVAPKGVFMNWVNRELPVHVWDAVAATARVEHWLPGGGSKAHRAALEKLLAPGPGLRVLVVNTEAFSTGRKAWDYVTRLLLSSRVGVKMSVDESTQIKNDSNRKDAVVELGQHQSVKYRRILTGSPVTRSPLDLFWQFFFLGKKLLGFASFYSFRARYAVMKSQVFGGRKVQIVVGYRDTEDLAKRIAPHSFRVRKDECLDLPPKVYVIREVELTEEQKRIYRGIREHATAALDGAAHVTATEVITQILRLHQVVCGHVVDEDGFLHDIPSNRVDALMEVLAEHSGKAIIWSRYRRCIQKIVEALTKEYGPGSVVQFHGGVDSVGRIDAVRRFQGDETAAHDPACRFMVSNQQTGGYGNTWTEADLEVFYSNDYSLEKRLQAEDRPHRAGQTKSVTVLDLIVRGTVEEKILKALRANIDIASTIMGDGYREWLI